MSARARSWRGRHDPWKSAFFGLAAAAAVRLGTPLIRVDTEAVARRVERITQVQAARVTRSWPDAIVIWTKRRTAVFAVPANRGYRLVDSYGVVLGRASVAPAGLVVLRAPAWPAGALRRGPAAAPGVAQQPIIANRDAGHGEAS